MRIPPLLFLLLLAGCATSPDTGPGGGDASEITREQIAETGASNLYDVVRMLHREWLPRRQGSYVVVADQNHLVWGRVNANDTREDLNQNLGLSRFMQPGWSERVYVVELISATEAGRYWSDLVGDRDCTGAIIVWTRPKGGGPPR